MSDCFNFFLHSFMTCLSGYVLVHSFQHLGTAFLREVFFLNFLMSCIVTIPKCCLGRILFIIFFSQQLDLFASWLLHVQLLVSALNGGAKAATEKGVAGPCNRWQVCVALIAIL